MKGTLNFAPLGSQDAKRIHRLQARLFPPALRDELSEIRDILTNTEEFMVCNLSFGLFDGTKLVGYTFAYVESKSIYYRRPEEVVYLKEVALTPGYQKYFHRLFLKLYEQWLAFVPTLPLEAHALEDSLQTWQRIVRVMRHYGLSLSTIAEEPQPGRPPYHLLRFDVAEDIQYLHERPLPIPRPVFACQDEVTVTLLTDPRQWLTLKSEWGKLVEETDDSNVFQSFEYLWSWWKYCGIWNDLRIIVIRRSDAIIGVVPLMREQFEILGRPVNKLLFIGAPMEINRPKLLFGQESATCLPAFLAYLDNCADDWDIIDIDEQLHNDDTEAIRKHFRSGGYLVAESETLCPYIKVDSSWQHFFDTRSRRMRSNIRRLRRRLAELGDVKVRRVVTQSELDAAMEQHCNIEARSWKAQKKIDLKSSASNYFFYTSIATIFGARGEFELRMLECSGTVVASTFGIRNNGVFQSLRIAHDSQYNKYSPGTVLESYELEELFDGGIQCYEFIGSFLANKLRWTETVYKTSNIHVYRRNPALAVFFFTFFVFKRRVKAILKWSGQFDRVDRLLNRLGKNPIPRY